MRKVLIVSLILVLTLFWVILANGAEKEITIGFTPPSFVSPYWTYVLEAAKQEAEKEGVKLFTAAPKEHTDFEGQIRILEDFIQSKVDVIMIGVVDKVAVIPGLKRANEAGIPIVILNQIILQPGGIKVECYVGTDNFEGGAMVGEYCVKVLGGKGNIVLIEGIPGEASNERLEGWMSVVKNYPEMKIIASQVADWDEAKALTVMEDFLEAYPKIDLVFGLCDSMALGAITAAKYRNKLEDIIFVGYDGTLEALNSIKKGELRATLIQPPQNVGIMGVQSAVKIVKGETVPFVQKNPITLLTKENVDEFFKLYEK